MLDQSHLVLDFDLILQLLDKIYNEMQKDASNMNLIFDVCRR